MTSPLMIHVHVEYKSYHVHFIVTLTKISSRLCYHKCRYCSNCHEDTFEKFHSINFRHFLYIINKLISFSTE